MTQITEKISPIAVLVLLVPENFQNWKMYIENQTMRMTCKSGIPYKYNGYIVQVLEKYEDEF